MANYSVGSRPAATRPQFVAGSQRAATLLCLLFSLLASAAPLRLPAVYGDGMVLQRDTPLRISGSAEPGEAVTLTLGGNDYTARADNQGRWSVTTTPMEAGGPYEMIVTAPSGHLHFADILVGEVWLASGQSNMEFPIASEKDGVNIRPDSQLRFFDMKGRARPNSGRWSDADIAATDSLDYFLPTRWGAPTPESSAIAYNFARELRDSLQVPVGIIANPIGGAATESWIETATLQREMPEIMQDWLTNQYVQPWVQGRARENTDGHHHPYEPGYLFATGISPLGAFPVRGVIWYQGESNAHDTALHERLFPMLVGNWREEFRQPEMPFFFVQLSSLNRETWPEFRDSQRRMARRIPNVGMAVSSDVGDSLDVHPTRKLPVAHRLALQALRNTYGRNIVPEGPKPRYATAEDDGSVTLEFEWADGLATSDGCAPLTFEIAETDGQFLPAEATITPDNKITLRNMEVKKPRFVRYGWQPFTRANLVNGEQLPASTFRMEVTDIEPGLEAGVSACFAGRLPDGRIVMAGGCNFPNDPLGPTSPKKYYKGIYAATPDKMEWVRIGSLPEAMAYGVSVQTPDGIVMAGGTTADQAVRTVRLLGQDGQTDLPDLPVAIDNAAAVAIGRKVYIAGGNADGVPSRDLYVLDLDGGKWKRLKPMPGNPRVQPVLATDGHDLLLWGGFAGRHEGHEPTLELGGLRYNPDKNQWTEIEGLRDEQGEPLSVAGGVAVSFPEQNLVAVTGGVNKDIFLDAIRQTPEGYLTHPVEWYRFNGRVITVDTRTLEQQCTASDPSLARAGAAAVPVSDKAFYLIGGELKPRIRTAEIELVEL